MRAFLPVLAAVALLAGCGNVTSATTPSATPQPRSTTFTTERFAFSVSYDPSEFKASQTTDRYRLEVPGVGRVSSARLRLELHERGVPITKGAYISADSLRPNRRMTSGSVVGWKKAAVAKYRGAWIGTWRVRIVGAGETTVGGMRAFYVDLRLTSEWGRLRETTYTVYRGAFVYNIGILAPVERWSSLWPKLNAVAQSFRVPR